MNDKKHIINNISPVSASANLNVSADATEALNKVTDSALDVAKAIQSFFPDTDLDMLERSIQRYKDIDAWNETPVLEQDAFDRLQTVMQEAGELTEKAPYEVIVNNSFAKKVIE